MRKLYFIFCLIIPIIGWGQIKSPKADTLSNRDTLTVEHAEFSSVHNANNVTKTKGDSAYINGDYVTAIQIYEDLLKEGEAADIYYNLGNSYYKSDNIAKAILNYERALLLQPNNSDIHANLEIARAKTVDKVVSIPDIFFISWINSLIDCLNSDTWAKMGIVFFFLLLLTLCVFIFSKHIILKKISFITGLITLSLTILCNVFALQQKNKLTVKAKAIILSPSVTVRSTPSESGTGLFIIHEGHKVEIKDNSMHEWKEIRLEDGKVGWVPVSSIEII